jgi:WD40 repeat protein/DNA-binding SARP family transcriptional activator/energy-coupling factor transporter ATP-binding protein EcfA2
MAATVGVGLEIRLLGPVEALNDGRPLALGGARQRALLAALALRANEVASVEWLVDAMFGAEAADSSANAVQVAISRLRRQLDTETLQTRLGGYLLNLAPDQLDVARFERLLGEGRAHLAHGDAAGAAATLRAALGLFRGEPLADLASEEFAQAEIRRLEGLRLAALTERVEADLMAGGGADLVAELEGLVALHPLQERLRGQLILALYRAGRQSDALAEYRRMHALLREELGLEPSRALQELERSVLRHDPALDGAVTLRRAAVVACPFKGLASFTIDDGAIFFGRGRVVDALIAQLAAGTFVGLVGPSGSGKSSLLNAGLLAALSEGALPGSANWRVELLRPGDELPPMRGDGRTIVAVDQLEELFTTRRGEGERAAFLDTLVVLASDPKRRFVVAVALRADFYGRVAAFPEFATLLSANHVLVGAMKRDELAQAIEEPTARGGLQVERPLVDALVDDVEGEPGALPLLSSSLLELWQERQESTLTLASYRLLGGLRGAVARLAEGAYARLDPDEQEAARALLLRLATEEDGAIVRRRVRLDELGEDPTIARVLAVLTDARLLTVSEQTVEVSHEALLAEWPRLRAWLDEDREGRRVRAHLAASARDWVERGRNADDLYRGPRLAAAVEWADARPAEPTALEREFLAESRAERERELAQQRRRNRRLVAVLAVTVVLLVLAVVAGAVAVAQRHDARRKAAAALAGQVGAEAVSQPRIDLAMLLAVQAVKLHNSPQTESTLLATLLRSPSVIAEMASPIDSRPQRLVVSPDGRTVAVSDNNQTVRLYDVATRSVRASLPDQGLTQPVAFIGDGSRFASYGFDPNSGLQFVAIDDTRTFEVVKRLVFDRASMHEPTRGNSPPIVSRNGSTVFSVFDVLRGDGTDGAAFVDRWDMRTGRLVSKTPVGADGAAASALIRDDRQLLVVGTRYATIFDAHTMRRLRRIRVPAGFPAAISPDGRTAAVATAQGAISFVGLAKGSVRAAVGGLPSSVEALAFSHDGRFLATAGADGSIDVWETATGKISQRFTGHANRILGVAFSTDDRTLWTCSLDGAIFSWDLSRSRRFGRPFALPGGTPYGVGDIDPEPALAISRDGRAAAVRSGTTDVRLLDISTGLSRSVVNLTTGAVTSLAFSPTQPELALTSGNGAVQLWNVAGAPHLVRRLIGLHSANGDSETVESAAFSPDGKLLAAGDVNHTPGRTPYRLGAVAVWSVATGRVQWLVRNRDGWVHKVAFSPDGRSLGVAQEDGSVRVYDARSGKLERTLVMYGGAAKNGGSYDTFAFDADGDVATGTWSGIAQLWNTRGRQLARPTLAAAAPVASLAFSPHTSLLASVGGSDGTLKLWQTPSLASFGADFPLEPGTWGTAAFSPDGRRIVVLYSDGHGVIWPATLSAWMQHACSVAGRNLTPDEWSRYIGSTHYERTCS